MSHVWQKAINSKVNDQSYEFLIRKPTVNDGSMVWNLVKEAGELDVNSPYSYIMLFDLFKDTCAVAEIKEKIVGFVTAFKPSERKNALFIWQIAVAETHRGLGIGISLLKQLLEREENLGVRTVEATISPSNIPSRLLFNRLAKEFDTIIEISDGYTSNLFPENTNQTEDRVRIRVRGL